MKNFFKTLPLWYVAVLGILFALYLGGWGYTIHIAQVQTAAGQTPVMPVNEHDSTSYANLAQSLLSGHFAEPGQAYEYFHTPGYPAFVAAIYAVTHSYFAVTFIQILLVFATALLTYVLGTRILSPKVGMWASILFLLNPLTPVHAMYIVTDTLYTFLLILGFTLIVTKFTTKPLVTTLAVAALFAVAVYVRAVGFIAFPIFILPLLALQYPWKKKIGYAALMLGIIALALVPWMYRNYTHSGVFSFTSLVAFNMSFYSIPHFWSETQHIPLDQAILKVEKESGVPRGLNAQGYPMNWYDLASSPKLEAFVKNAVLREPFKYIAWHLYYSTAFFVAPAIAPQHLTKNIKGLLLKGQVKEAASALLEPWWYAAERASLVLGFMLLVLGIWRLRRNLLVWAFVLVILYVAALGGPSTAARYRLPVEPLLAVLMVAGLESLILWKKSRLKS
jgi:4-amino-4-deoxy-L-arabinose transferase-like glycosyltransferase